MKTKDLIIAAGVALAAFLIARNVREKAQQRQAAASRYGISNPDSAQARMLAEQDAAFL